MKILSALRGKQHTYTIATDDGRETPVDKTVWEHSGLSAGTEITDEKWQALLELSATHRAREKALYYLSLRDYGQNELTKKLCTAGVERELARQTTARLAESGLIDDTRYAAMLARDMSVRKLYPKRRVAMALAAKGFGSDIVATIISELPEEEEQQALELLRKKRYNTSGEPKLREKALGMLARYGFSYAVARRAVALREAEWNDEE